MRVRITCECGQVIDVEGRYGGTVTCPACGKTLTAPALQGPPATSTGPGSPAKRLKGLAIASMVVGIVACVPCCPVGCGVANGVLGLVAVGLGIPAMIGKLAGRAFGIAGVVMGLIGILWPVLVWGGFMTLAGGGLGPFGPKAPLTPPTVTPRAKATAPRALTADEIAEALTGRLRSVRTRSSIRAARELRLATAAFPGREASERKLYDCVWRFRQHLAYAGLSRPKDPAHRKMFELAGEELVDRVLAKYREAGEFQQDGRWDDAQQAYKELSGWISRTDDPVLKNVRAQISYCRNRARKADDE